VASNPRRYALRWQAVLTGLLVACGGSSPTPTAQIPVTSTPFPQSTPLVFRMVGVGPANAGITGDVEVVKGSDAFTLTIRLHGLAPSSEHSAHLRLGSCAANGPIDVTLQPLAADGTGSATSITNVPKPYQVPAAGWYAGVQGDNAINLACGDLKAA
jgi:hypothetical protein